MRTRSPAFLSSLMAAALLTACALDAAPMRLSFLDERSAVDDTVQFLGNSICSKEAATVYQHAVLSYVFDKSEFDLSGFPAPSKGFYSFPSINKLLFALPTNAFHSSHPATFNCFDAVIVLAGGHLRSRLYPDDLSGPYLVPKFNTNGDAPTVGTMVMETPRDAYNEVYPLFMRQASEPFIPDSMRDSRICLTAALFRQYVVPMSTVSNTFAVKTLEVLRSAWRRDGLKFPEGYELVLVHGAKSLDVTTEHAGLLIPHGKGFTYVEKLGAAGPFIRLDFEDRFDLVLWLSVLWECKGHDGHLVTFNDAAIERLRVVVFHNGSP